MICVIVEVKKPLVTGRMEISQSKSLISRLYCGEKNPRTFPFTCIELLDSSVEVEKRETASAL